MDPEEFATAVERDELEDIASSGLMAPRDYAKYRGIYPQRVYQHIRTGKLEGTYCACGRKVVRVAEADAVFGFDVHFSDPDPDTDPDKE